MNNISRNFIYLFLPVLTLSILSGCVKNEFSVDFNLDTGINTTARVVYYGSDSHGGILIESAVAIASGKGELKGITKRPCVLWVFEGRSQLPSCVIFAERGDKIKVTGRKSSPADWEVAGNKVNKLLTKWRIDNRDIISDAVTSLGKEDTKPRLRLNEAIEKFVKSNPDSPASLIVLSAWFDAGIAPEKYDELVKKLSDSGVMDKYPSLLLRSDLLTPSEAVGGYETISFPDIVVRSVPKGADTLRVKTGNRPSVIYLWHKDDDTRRENIDSLNRLAKWRGDSARFLIADISLEADSAVWVFSLRNDTISKTVRGWMPRGEADPDIMRIGVRSTPWWIVTSSKGKMEYSGPDTKKALTLIRKLSPKTQPQER